MKLNFVLLLSASISGSVQAFTYLASTPQSCHHHHQHYYQSHHQLNLMEPKHSTYLDLMEEETLKDAKHNPSDDIDLENIEEELSLAQYEFLAFQETHNAFLKQQQAPVVSYPVLKKRMKQEPTTVVPVVSKNDQKQHTDTIFLGDDIYDVTGLPFVSAAAIASSQQEIEMDPFGVEENSLPAPFVLALNTLDDDDAVEGDDVLGTA